MYQTDNDVVVKATLPGMKADDVQINITGDVAQHQRRDEGKERDEGEELSYPRTALGSVLNVV